MVLRVESKATSVMNSSESVHSEAIYTGYFAEMIKYAKCKTQSVAS